MNANKRMKYFRTGLVLVASLLLWNPLPAFAQHGGAAMHGGEMPGGIAMQEVSGKVVETMDSGGYTYALVDKAGARTWVALPMSKIAVGDEIACRPGMVMNNFRSSSLQRIFKQIVFSGGLTSATSATSATSDDAAAAHGSTPAPAEVTEEPKPKRPEDWKGF